MSTSISTINKESIERSARNGKPSKTRRRAPDEKYPLASTVFAFVEPWMGYLAIITFVITITLRYFHLVGTPWLVAIPVLTLLLFVAVRAPRNRSRLRFLKQEYLDRVQRAARYRALVKSAREAVDELSAEKYSILEKSAASGQNMATVLEKLDEYEKDYTDLLYLYQERARRLKSIRERNFASARKTLADDRKRLEESQDKSSQTYQRMALALNQQESLITRQEQVAAELEGSLSLIKQQARNIQSMFELVSDQITAMPLGVNWGAGARFDEFEDLSNSIQMTKETLNAMEGPY